MTQPFVRHLHPGQHYIDFLARFAVGSKAASYFEIGVNIGKSLRRINLPSVGVDPKFIFRDDVMGSKSELHLYQQTSDDFFAQHDLKSYFPSGVDLAFLDGMHLFEYLLRDLINVEKSMAPEGTVFMHDCLPINAEMAERHRRPGGRRDVELKSYWTGDVWKLVPILKRHRPDLKVTYLDCRPTGLVMIQNLDSSSTSLSAAYQGIVDEWSEVELDDAGLEQFYADLHVTPADEVLQHLG